MTIEDIKAFVRAKIRAYDIMNSLTISNEQKELKVEWENMYYRLSADNMYNVTSLKHTLALNLQYLKQSKKENRPIFKVFEELFYFIDDEGKGDKY